MAQPSDSKKYWLDDPANVSKLYRGLWAISIAVLCIDLIVHRHEDFGFATLFGLSLIHISEPTRPY